MQAEHPDVLFLAEAFTRPKVMARLAEAGFSQSYTYFTWRTEQHGPKGCWAYLEELAHGPVADYMRPNFWPNTPDILSGPLRHGPPAAFALRLVLAATLSPSYGRLQRLRAVREPAGVGDQRGVPQLREVRDQGPGLRPARQPGPADGAAQRIRRRHPAFQRLRSIRFHPTTNPQIIAYSQGRATTATDVVLMVVNLDPYRRQEATMHARPRPRWGCRSAGRTRSYDELSGETYEWSGLDPYVRLDPSPRWPTCSTRGRWRRHVDEPPLAVRTRAPLVPAGGVLRDPGPGLLRRQ